MSSTIDFIADLFRSANEVEKLTAFEKRRLLNALLRRYEMGSQVNFSGRAIGLDVTTE